MRWKKQNTCKANNGIAKRFSTVKRKYKNGTLDAIIKKVNQEFNLHDTKILPSAIRQHFYRKKKVCHHVSDQNIMFPLEKLESIVIIIIIHMARNCQSLCPSKGLMIIKSLIKNTDIQTKLVAWQQKDSNNNLPTDSLGY